ncbi:N-acetylmuramoyl-L-alanine amidase [Antarctobacter heliothermus]|uniref:N-acetylmuramoyl-L-alanine amidase n=1 Tax=Antarctobacter heliothermus TaxID=74033 RepID=A0A239B7V7_9RHOB|nr:N-acetylmuramoyl-L-alanine amidase [Antarctobacter heliothermus]SNS03631.1 N-acetylmuramoyl-L-alanine amidase [Antarctobacter heliothermus]
MTPETIWHPSPNFGDRRGSVAPDMVVLHYTAMTSAEAARDWLCAPESEVSCHYVIAEDGRLWQLVQEADRAWHAGRGCWGAVGDINSHSIGIELANTGFHPFPEPQMAVLETVLAGITARWSITPRRVVGHSDTALGRKTDPGGRFDWRRLALRGLSVWPEQTECALDEPRFWADCTAFGYEVTPQTKEDVLNAIRLRFRPWAKGPLGADDCAVMADLADRFPCRRSPLRA